LSKKSIVETKVWLEKHYLDSAPAKSTVEKCFAKLKRGEMCTEGDARTGRPKEAVFDENIKNVHKIILNYRKVNLIEIAETLTISKKCIEHIVHEYFHMLKLFAKWLPHLLTIDQNQQRVDDSEQCLAIFNRNKRQIFPLICYNGCNMAALQHSRVQ
jgi:hypothetical protein